MLQMGHSDIKDRQAYVAGTFYPANAGVLEDTLREYFEKKPNDNTYGSVRALISPHAGYVFSGSVAASAFASLDRSKEYKRVFILGSSHKFRFNGAALYTNGDFISPMGKIEVDQELSNTLISGNKIFTNYPAAHLEEHSIEVQLPFLQYLYKENLKIVPLLIGTDSAQQCKEIAEELRPWFNADNLFVISSDFSHYPEYNKALELDGITMEKLISSGPEKFTEWISSCEKKQAYGAVTPMCGWTAGLVLKYLAGAESELKFSHIDYINSGDTNLGDKKGVVGYHAIVLSKEENNKFRLSSQDRSTLLKLARNNIKSRLYEGCFIKVAEEDFKTPLNSILGAFVTLRTGTKLRGCIGRIHASEPLYETIKQMSAAAAFNDSRFEPISKDELEDVKIEISVLSEMRKIDSIDEIKPGTHGVYLKKGIISATFLPQVASEQKWNREELLGNLSKNKAGLGWLGWKDTDIYIYEADVFEEDR